jgi:hypothetical protein
MKTILHNFDVDADPAQILRAISTLDGIRGWWTTEVAGSDEIGGIIELTFDGDFNPQMLVEESGPAVAWRCVGGHDPWLDNRFRFEATSEQPAVVFFRQDYANELSDAAYGRYNFLWGFYLESLRGYVEDGTGKPFSP